MAAEPHQTTLLGFTKAQYLTDEQIEQILDAIREGVHPTQACRDAGTSSTQFGTRRRRDPEVQSRFEDAMREYESHGRLAKLHSELDYHIFEAKNWQALREQLLIHDPDYEVLRTQRFQVGVTAETLGEAAKDAFADLTDEQIEERLAMLQAAKASNVIELPQRTGESDSG